MRGLWAQTVQAVNVGNLCRLGNDDAYQLDHGILEHEDPGYLRPHEVRWRLLLSLDGGEGFLVKRSGRCSILNE